MALLCKVRQASPTVMGCGVWRCVEYGGVWGRGVCTYDTVEEVRLLQVLQLHFGSLEADLDLVLRFRAPAAQPSLQLIEGWRGDEDEARVQARLFDNLCPLPHPMPM